MNGKAAVFMGMGFELVCLVLGGAYLGGFVDRYMQWKGYATAGLIIAFLVSWFYHLVILMRNMGEADDDSDQGHS